MASGRASGEPGRPLEAAAEAARLERRDARYQLRERLAPITTQRRAAKCGKNRVKKDQSPQLHLNNGVAHFSGLQLCGLVHVCPVCGPKIRQQKANDIDQAAATWMKEHGIGSVGFLSLTLPHDHGDRLKATLGTIRGALSDVLQGRAWQADKKGYGIQFYIAGHDSTVGPNGWHPHLHILLFWDAPLDDAALGALTERLYTRWRSAVVRRGHRPPSREHGISLERAKRRADVARYICQVIAGDSEQGIPVALEVARGDLKTSRRHGHRTPWQVLGDLTSRRASVEEWTDAADAADTRDLALWHEWERATKGLPSIRWARGLRAAVGLSVVEKTDEEIAAADVGGEVVCEFDRNAWEAIRCVRDGRAQVLRAAEVGGKRLVRKVVATLLRQWAATTYHRRQRHKADWQPPRIP